MGCDEEIRGRYKVIIGDPPWSYKNEATNGAAVNHYDTMKLSDICALPVDAIAHRDAVLFLWATNPLLPEALQVIKAWGFKYKTCFPWVKVKGDSEDTSQYGFGFANDTTLTVAQQLDKTKLAFGTGFWVRTCTEMILVCSRGDAKCPEPDDRCLGLISNRFEHSRKPESVHELALGLEGPRLEMFARRRLKVDGFEYWGNEVPGGNDVELVGV